MEFKLWYLTYWTSTLLSMLGLLFSMNCSSLNLKIGCLDAFIILVTMESIIVQKYLIVLTLPVSLLTHYFTLYVRALRTINIREESEKLNVWVAYFNLENEYGNPPEVQWRAQPPLLTPSESCPDWNSFVKTFNYNFPFSGGCYENISKSIAVLWSQKGASCSSGNVWENRTA